MKHLYTLLALLFFISISSCENNMDSDNEPFLLKIDSFTVKQPITSTSVELLLYATIGNNGCFYYSGYQMRERHQVLDIAFFGNKENAEICSQEMRYLEGESIKHRFSCGGNWLIKITQPDNTYLTKIINIPLDDSLSNK